MCPSQQFTFRQFQLDEATESSGDSDLAMAAVLQEAPVHAGIAHEDGFLALAELSKPPTPERKPAESPIAAQFSPRSPRLHSPRRETTTAIELVPICLTARTGRTSDLSDSSFEESESQPTLEPEESSDAEIAGVSFVAAIQARLVEYRQQQMQEPAPRKKLRDTYTRLVTNGIRKLDLVGHCINKVEAQFGSGVAHAFSFERYLLVALLFTFLIPTALWILWPAATVDRLVARWSGSIMDFYDGTMMVGSNVFQASYPRNATLSDHTTALLLRSSLPFFLGPKEYNFAVAFAVVSLVSLMAYTAVVVFKYCRIQLGSAGIRRAKNVLVTESITYPFSTLAFCQWDWGILNQHTAEDLQSSICLRLNELLASLRNETLMQTDRRYTMRATLRNIASVVLSILLAAGFVAIVIFIGRPSFNKGTEAVSSWVIPLVVSCASSLIPFIVRMLVAYLEVHPHVDDITLRQVRRVFALNTFNLAILSLRMTASLWIRKAGQNVVAGLPVSEWAGGARFLAVAPALIRRFLLALSATDTDPLTVAAMGRHDSPLVSAATPEGWLRAAEQAASDATEQVCIAERYGKEFWALACSDFAIGLLIILVYPQVFRLFMHRKPIFTPSKLVIEALHKSSILLLGFFFAPGLVLVELVFATLIYAMRFVDLFEWSQPQFQAWSASSTEQRSHYALLAVAVALAWFVYFIGALSADTCGPTSDTHSTVLRALGDAVSQISFFWSGVSWGDAIGVLFHPVVLLSAVFILIVVLTLNSGRLQRQRRLFSNEHKDKISIKRQFAAATRRLNDFRELVAERTAEDRERYSALSRRFRSLRSMNVSYETQLDMLSVGLEQLVKSPEGPTRESILSLIADVQAVNAGEMLDLTARASSEEPDRSPPVLPDVGSSDFLKHF